jgi:DNA (cytosine-5)-methyltransferase 1
MDKKIKVGSDFSGVGAFDQALIRLNIDYESIFSCDMDKYARQTYIHNYGQPKYYPENVYDREIPKESLDFYMTSPPCQAFSLAGKRKGEDDKRGILFYNSHEFIQKNKPRYFIFENVKGLLSDDKGKTFQRWIDYLAGKSVNGNPTIFPHDESVPYHVYYQVLNAKNYGIPQNRERVFIVGIRDDQDNFFSFPKPFHLVKRLKDVLEDNIDEKYFLSNEAINRLCYNDSGFSSEIKNENSVGNTICAGDYKLSRGMNVLQENEHKKIKISDFKVCYSDVIIHDIPEIVNVRKTEVDIAQLQKILKEHKKKSIFQISKELNANKTTVEHWFRTDKYFSIPDAEIWFELKKCLNIESNEFDLSITEFVEKEGVFEKSNRVYDDRGIAPTITSTSADEKIMNYKKLNDSQQEKFDKLNVDENISGCLTEPIGRAGSSDEYMSMVKRNALLTGRIRRLTPRECFRLMDFPDTFDFSVVSNSQAYKQAGNSIVVNVLCQIIKKLKL